MKKIKKVICWCCGGCVVWDSDATFEEVYGEGRGAVSFLHCKECEVNIKYIVKDGEE